MGERFRFALTATAYNLLNHPNFGAPTSDVASGQLGAIWNTVCPPASAYGAFQGSAVSGRVIVISARMHF